MLSNITLGYGIPITINSIGKLRHTEVYYPGGLQHQQTFNELGEIILIREGSPTTSQIGATSWLQHASQSTKE